MQQDIVDHSGMVQAVVDRTKTLQQANKDPQLLNLITDITTRYQNMTQTAKVTSLNLFWKMFSFLKQEYLQFVSLFIVGSCHNAIILT